VAPAPGEAGFNERNRKDLTASDVRFTTRNGAVFAFVMGWPERQASIAALAPDGNLGVGKIRTVELLGHKGRLKFTQDASGLRIELPAARPSDYAVAFRVVGA
jgi:alpha-L-fucosidase